MWNKSVYVSLKKMIRDKNNWQRFHRRSFILKNKRPKNTIITD